MNIELNSELLIEWKSPLLCYNQVATSSQLINNVYLLNPEASKPSFKPIWKLMCFLNSKKIRPGRDSYPAVSVFPLSDGVLRQCLSILWRTSIKRSHLYFYRPRDRKCKLGNFADEEQNQTFLIYKGITIFDKGRATWTNVNGVFWPAKIQYHSSINEHLTLVLHVYATLSGKQYTIMRPH